MTQLPTKCPPSETLRNLFNDQSINADELNEHLVNCTRCQSLLEQWSDSGRLNGVKEIIQSSVDEWDFLEAPKRTNDLGAIDHLLIEEEIGRGGLGVVFRALDTKLGREVAVKVLHNDKSGRANSRFFRESQAAASVSGDNVVNVYSVGRTRNQRPYLVMPLIIGVSLADQLKNEVPSFHETARLIEQVALGLGSVHEQGITHRDVKPANILIEHATGRALLTDFGLAKSFSDETLTKANVVSGTPEYMSPEQAVGSDDLGPSADIYSLGITLYECLTGKPPFRGVPMEVLQRHCNETPIHPSRLNSSVPRDLEVICCKAIAKDPSRRYSSASDLADELARFRAGQPIMARPVSVLETGWLWCKRNPRIATLAGLFVFTLVSASTISTALWRAAAENARLANERSSQIEIQGNKLAKSNETLLNSIDTFYARVVGDRSSGMQLSRQFRNEMVAELISLYDTLIEQNPEDLGLAIRICTRICDVSDLLNEMQHFYQAADLSAWNWNRIRNKTNVPEAGPELLTVAARCAHQVSSNAHGLISSKTPFPNNFDEESMSPDVMYQKAIDLAKLASDRGGGVETQGIELFARACLTTRGKNGLAPQTKYSELARLGDQLDQLIERNPNSYRLHGFRSGIAFECLTFGEPADEDRQWEIAINASLRELKARIAHKKPEIWVRRKIVLFRRRRAVALARNGDLNSAKTIFQETINDLSVILDSTPTFLQAHQELAKTCLAMADQFWEIGETEKAQELYHSGFQSFQDYIKLEPRASWVIYTKSATQFLVARKLATANLKERSKRYFQESIDDFRRIFDLPSNYYNLSWYKGFHNQLTESAKELEKMGFDELALSYREEAKQIESNHPDQFAKTKD